MTATIPTWGYRKGEARVFELPDGGNLPPGWYDSPAKIPSGEPPAGQGGERPVAAQASPVVSPPPPSIDEQERAEHRRVLAENEQLKAYVADLEALLAQQIDLPPPPAGDQPSISEVLARVGRAEDGGPELVPRPLTPIEKARAAKAAKRERDKDPPA